jgi:stress response protein YsnF
MSAYEKIVTLYDTAEHAQAAKANLKHAGFFENDISTVSADALPKGGTALREPGLWQRLFGQGIQEQEASVYAKAVESGGVVLTLRAAQEDIPKAMGILNQHNVIDVKDRAIDTGAFSKAQAAGTPLGTGNAQAAGTPLGPVPVPAKPITADLGKQQVMRLAEEHLDVGKRLVEQGTTRIRRFLTQQPVEQKVALHEEHAEVVRRAIEDPNYVRDVDWSDQTVEIRETAEEPMVTKSTRVAEEIIIDKTGSDRVETIRDTVRKQQAQVEKVIPDVRKKAS